ncbi:MAG: hypothetical protein JST92_27690, partial [Deltaproteobacteria bacterium]|nr:hypothetical protein [Deltaproteobacteria bacterium]
EAGSTSTDSISGSSAAAGMRGFIPASSISSDDGPDEHLQRGTGSVDGMFGLSYVYGDLPWVAYANVTGRVNGKNERDFQYGNAIFGTLGLRRSFLDTHNLVLALEAQLRSAGKDRIGDGSTDPDSGGQVYYGALSAAYAFDEHWFVRAVAQVPVAANLNGDQSEHPVVYLGVAYDLNL